MSQQEIVIPYRPRKQFLGFHGQANRWKICVAHRRCGKTVACINHLIRSALLLPSNDGRFAYVAPTFVQAKDIAWSYIKKFTYCIPGMGYNESELRADFPNGSRIRLYGADNPDRLRGIYLDGVVLDEFGDMKPRVWGEVIRPLLADRRGFAVFIGTPKGKNEFWDLWSRAKNDPDWFSLMLRASETGILAAEELADASKGMTEDQIAQEFECSFEAAIVGAYYGKELRQLDARGHMCEVPYDKASPVHTAWDLGWRDDTSIWWYQVIRGEIHLLDYHGSNGQPIEYYADLINSKPYKYGYHHLPHDAKAKTLASGGKSIEEQLAALLTWKTLRLVPDLSLQDGIQAVRMALPQCWFDPKCEQGLEALRQYQREWDDDRKMFRDGPRHDWTSHAADAFRYMAIACKDETSKTVDKNTDLTKMPTFNEVFWADQNKSWTRI